MVRKVIIVFLLTLVFIHSKSQNIINQQVYVKRCASPQVDLKYEEAFQQMVQKYQQFSNGKTTSTIYNIPVIFHVLHSGTAVNTASATSGRNLSAAQINSQLAILNADYRKLNTDLNTYVTQSSFLNVSADVQINFCMAKVDPNGIELVEPGIDRIKVSTMGWISLPYPRYYIESNVKPASSWDPTKYFNVWILEFGGADVGTLGYAQFPTIPSSNLSPVSDMYGIASGAANTDGVVIDYKFIGDTGTALGNVGTPFAGYDKGRTLTHEVGHWLGLWHIWGDDNGACSPGTDFVSDTPNQGGENYTCPTPNGTILVDACSPSGVMYQNYMDYSDDKCLVMFTEGQKSRMQTVMANCPRRKSLTTSTVCTVAGIHEYSNNIEVEIYPNPTDGELNISISSLDIQDFSISIINTLGQTVKDVKHVQSNGGKLKIDLSEMNSGVYFISIKTKFGSKVKRIVLQ
jgi:hypothetical protein